MTTQPGRVGREVPSWLAVLGDRGVRSGLVLVAVAAAGLAGLGLAWSGTAATSAVWEQTAFVVSGGFGGLALAGACLALVAVHTERRAAATDRLRFGSVLQLSVDVAERLPEVIAALTASRPDLPLVTNGRTLHRADCRIAQGKGLRPARPSERADLRACAICQP